MDKPARSGVVLLSLHPRWSEAILSGEKRTELRKTRFDQAVSHVVIYSTAPVQRIVGWFEVGSVRQDSPAEIWQKVSGDSGLSKEEFMAYFEDRHTAVAIEVLKPTRLQRPVRLHKLADWLLAPQSFRYVPDELLGVLKELNHTAAIPSVV